MNRMEQHMELIDQTVEIRPSIMQPQLVYLVEQLFTPYLSEENRIYIACQMKKMICCSNLTQSKFDIVLL